MDQCKLQSRLIFLNRVFDFWVFYSRVPPIILEELSEPNVKYKLIILGSSCTWTHVKELTWTDRIEPTPSAVQWRWTRCTILLLSGVSGRSRDKNNICNTILDHFSLASIPTSSHLSLWELVASNIESIVLYKRIPLDKFPLKVNVFVILIKNA